MKYSHIVMALPHEKCLFNSKRSRANQTHPPFQLLRTGVYSISISQHQTRCIINGGTH